MLLIGAEGKPFVGRPATVTDKSVEDDIFHGIQRGIKRNTQRRGLGFPQLRNLHAFGHGIGVGKTDRPNRNGGIATEGAGTKGKPGSIIQSDLPPGCSNRFGNGGHRCHDWPDRTGPATSAAPWRRVTSLTRLDRLDSG